MNKLEFFFIKPSGDTGVYRYWFHHYPLEGRYAAMTLDVPVATVGGRWVTLPVPPQQIDGITYVPVLFLAEAFGLEIAWDEGTRTAVRLADGHLIVPLRFVSESLGATVRWQPEKKGIVVTFPDGEAESE